ncbi:hypothetical protein Hanom_Chr05g00417541 [Helianthus anomalus]
MRVKKVESENMSLLKKIEADQTEINILKVKVAKLEEEKARRDEQNKYFELKNKELEVAKAVKEHELYIINKVLENMLRKSVEQRFEEIAVEEVREKRQEEIDAQMKDKGKGVEGSVNAERSIVLSIDPESPIQNPVPIYVDDDEEDDDEEDDDDEKVFSTSSHSSDDKNDDDDQGGTSVSVTESSKVQNVDDYMHDDANDDQDNDAESEGEQVNDQNDDKVEKLILRLEPEVEEGEFRHVYTMADIKEMTRMYEYKYVDEADNYDRVEVEDCTDEENVNEYTSKFPTLVEFFSQENRDELRRKVTEILKDKNFDGTTKDPLKEERKKWFRKNTERKFKRPLKFYKRDRDVSLGDIISWGFLPQVNAYAIRREYSVKYF